MMNNTHALLDALIDDGRGPGVVPLLTRQLPFQLLLGDLVLEHGLGLQKLALELVHVVDVLERGERAHRQQLREQGAVHQDRDHDGQRAGRAQAEGVAPRAPRGVGLAGPRDALHAVDARGQERVADGHSAAQRAVVQLLARVVPVRVVVRRLRRPVAGGSRRRCV